MSPHPISRATVGLALLCLAALSGCSIAPKTFRKVVDPAPIVRARSVSLGSKLPPDRVVPALIDRLEDNDGVVRLVAYEELKKKTGRTFGYLPWGTDPERAGAVERWRSWWQAQSQSQSADSRVNRSP